MHECDNIASLTKSFSCLGKLWIGYGISSLEMHLLILIDKISRSMTAPLRLVTTPIKLTQVNDQERIL